MAYVGVTTKEYEPQLSALGMSIVRPEVLDDIPQVSQVFIYDYNGAFSKSYLREVIARGNNLVYCFHNDGESNTQFLSEIGAYNSYSDVEPSDLTADFVQKKFAMKNSLENVKSIIQKKGTITTFNLNLQSLDDFLKAIETKDKEAIISTFNESFDKFVDIKLQVDKQLAEIETLKRDAVLLGNEKAEVLSKLKALTIKYEQTLRDGRLVEQDNKKLAEGIKNLDSMLKEKDRALVALNDRANNLQIELTHKDTRITELSNKLVETSNLCNTLKINNESLTKQMHTMSTSLTQTFSSEKIKLQLSDTGTVNKILYIKVIDPVPYLVSSLINFPLYISSVRKMQNGCAMVLITPQDSTIYEQYSKQHPIVSDTATYENCSGKMFVMEGYNTALEKFIKTCKCDMCVILDMTFKTTPLTDSFKQKNVYIINSEETLDRYILNPRECLSFNTDISRNIAGFIPRLTTEELSVTYKAQKKLKDNLYSVLDTLWG